MPGILPTSKTRVSIGAASADPITLASYTSDTTFKLIGGVTNVGSFGDTRSLITSDWVGEGRTKKTTGNSNAGTLELACDRILGDVGQEAMLAAVQATGTRFNIKIETPVGNNKFETHYMPGIVMSGALNLAGANSVQSRAFTIELDDAPLVVAPPA